MITLPAPDRPRASVVIPAWRQAGLLRRCLESLAQHVSADPFETVILLNGATPEVRLLVTGEVEGARVVPSRVNLGFGRGCNRAAKAATGEFLVLLNDDAEVQPGWLDALVRTADAHSDAGAVGSRIVSHDGLLLEAGGLVWREGVSSHVGRGLPEATRRHRFLRRADYCSAASLLVRRSAWDAVGGFDEAYFPGYYEDVDLCLSLARLGWQVLFEPRSCARHYESGSLEWDSPYKRFVAARSQARFIAKWSDELSRFPALPQTDDPWARDIVDERALLASRRLHRRLLVVDDAISPRLAAALEEMATRGTAVSVFLGSGDGVDDHLAGLGVEVVDGDIIAHLVRPTVLYDAILFRRPEQFQALAGAVRSLQPHAALLYDADDVASDVLRLADAVTSPGGSPLLRSDRVLCGNDYDAGLLALVPRHAPVAPTGQSWADAVAVARRAAARR